jgi:hypothetical protein
MEPMSYGPDGRKPLGLQAWLESLAADAFRRPSVEERSVGVSSPVPRS